MFWRKKGSDANSQVKMFFASDLHGSNVCFKKFVNGAQFYGADVLVLGGDLTGKAVIPIAEQDDGSFIAFQHGEAVKINDQAELDDFVKRQGNMGFYPTVMSEAEYQRLKADPEGQAALFKQLVLERVREWATFAAAKIEGRGHSAGRPPRQRRLPRDRRDPHPGRMHRIPRDAGLRVQGRLPDAVLRRLDADAVGHRARIYRGAIRLPLRANSYRKSAT